MHIHNAHTVQEGLLGGQWEKAAVPGLSFKNGVRMDFEVCTRGMGCRLMEMDVMA